VSKEVFTASKIFTNLKEYGEQLSKNNEIRYEPNSKALFLSFIVSL
jgi:hypothetical protein